MVNGWNIIKALNECEAIKCEQKIKKKKYNTARWCRGCLKRDQLCIYVNLRHTIIRDSAIWLEKAYPPWYRLHAAVLVPYSRTPHCAFTISFHIFASVTFVLRYCSDVPRYTLCAPAWIFIQTFSEIVETIPKFPRNSIILAKNLVSALLRV